MPMANVWTGTEWEMLVTSQPGFPAPSMFGLSASSSSRPNGSGKSFAHLWWLNPCWPLALMLLGTGISAYIIPSSDYVENWLAPKYFDIDSLYYIFFCVAGFVITGGIFHFAAGRFTPSPDAQIHTNPRLPWPVIWFLFYLCFGLSVFGYAAWLVASVAHGLSPSDILAAVHNAPGAVYVIRDKTETVPGVTTFTQLEMAMSLLGVLLGYRFGWRKNITRLVVPMAFVFILAALRAHFREERIAILEIIIPVTILALALARTSLWTARWRVVLALLPLAAPLGLYLFFSLAEYSRSWVNFYQDNGQDSFFWFTFSRLAGYYVTALNNGAAYVQTMGHHGNYGPPYFSLEWFWKFPVIKDVFSYASIAGFDPGTNYTDFLQQKLNPELNNPSGVFVLEIDYGFVGGIVAWCLLGAIASLLYRLFMSGSLAGLLLYPFFYIGLLESPRILYWTDSRSLPTWFLLFAVSVLGALAAQGDWRKPRVIRAVFPAGRGWRSWKDVRYPLRRGL